jgi:hypothetical protein
MKRKEFLNKCSTCGALSLLGLFNLDKKLNVRIDESIMLGGERCSTTIFVVDQS